MAIIRAQRLFLGSTPAGVTAIVYTCPSGVRSILRAADFSATGIAPVTSTLWFSLRDAATGTEGLIMLARMQADVPYAAYRGTVVMYPGDTLGVQVADWGCFYQGSGAVLPL